MDLIYVEFDRQTDQKKAKNKQKLTINSSKQ